MQSLEYKNSVGFKLKFVY